MNPLPDKPLKIKYKMILVIDDDQDDHFLFNAAAEQIPEKPDIYFYTSALEALHDLEKELMLPDLILLDINMPIMNGMQFLKEIKSRAHLSCIPVVMHTTASDERTKEICLDLGAADYLVKPSSFSILTQVLNKLFLSEDTPTEIVS